jgi:hypothetical protein
MLKLMQSAISFVEVIAAFLTIPVFIVASVYFIRRRNQGRKAWPVLALPLLAYLVLAFMLVSMEEPRIAPIRDYIPHYRGPGDIPNTLSQEEAIAAVMQRPEVKTWMAAFSGPGGVSPITGGRPQFLVISETATEYEIKAFESMEDRDLTFDRYHVNKETGSVTGNLEDYYRETPGD